MKKIFTLMLILVLLTACVKATAPAPGPAHDDPVSTGAQGLPNPASVYCQEKGYTVEIRTANDGSQAGFCIFPDGSECDEWAYYRGECTPASETTPESQPTEGIVPIEPPAEPTIDLTLYDGWVTYTHPMYGFSFMLPADWVVEEDISGDSTLNGHLVTIKPGDGAGQESIRLTFREAGDTNLLLWPTGVGQGEFVTQGTLEIGGQPVQRITLVCPTGEVTSIYYHPSSEQPNISMGNLEFGVIYSAAATHCEPGATLVGKTLTNGEMVIASLKAP